MDSLRRPCRPSFLPLLALLLLISSPPVEAEWEKGTKAFQQGRFADAVREFGQATKTHPDYAAGHYMLGLALNQTERPSEAIASLQRAFSLAPEEPSYTLALAQTLVQVKRPHDALTALAGNDLSKLAPKLQSSYATVFAAAASQVEPATALPLLRNAAAQHDASPDLWIALGSAATKTDLLEEGFRAYEKALRLDPSREALGYKTFTVALQVAETAVEGADKQARYRRAAELGESIRRTDLGESGRLLPGEAWLQAGDPKAARAWFQKALQDRPGDPAAELGLARALLELDETPEAQQALQRALKASPDPKLFASIQRRLGYTYHQLEQYELASEAYRLGGDQEKASEMKDYQKLAQLNLTIDRLRKECKEKADRIARIKAEQKDIFPAEEWASIERDLDLSLSDCRHYLDAT